MLTQLIIHPDLETRRPYILELLRALQLSFPHPNLLWLEEEKLGIEEARKALAHLGLKPYQAGPQALVILQAEKLTDEAQNALLKLLEEPPGDCLIILGVSDEQLLLPTILSRCQIVGINTATGLTSNQNIPRQDKFLLDLPKLFSASWADRFIYIEKLAEREGFLIYLTYYFNKLLISQDFSTYTQDEIVQFLKELIRSEKWAKQNVNIRGILEHLMLKLPIIKLD